MGCVWVGMIVFPTVWQWSISFEKMCLSSLNMSTMFLSKALTMSKYSLLLFLQIRVKCYIQIPFILLRLQFHEHLFLWTFTRNWSVGRLSIGLASCPGVCLPYSPTLTEEKIERFTLEKEGNSFKIWLYKSALIFNVSHELNCHVFLRRNEY